VIERLGISFLSHFRAHSYNHSLEAAISILQVYNVIFDIPWFQQDSESGRLILMEKLEVAMGFNNLKLLRGFFPDCSAAAATLATKSVEKRNRWPDFYYTSHDFMEILIATVGEMLREISPGETANDVREGVNFVFKNLETLLPADGHAIQAIRPRRTQFLQEWEQS
jgi:hypothetical protein